MDEVFLTVKSRGRVGSMTCASRTAIRDKFFTGFFRLLEVYLKPVGMLASVALTMNFT